MFPLFDLRHPRDSKSSTPRGGTLYQYEVRSIPNNSSSAPEDASQSYWIRLSTSYLVPGSQYLVRHSQNVGFRRPRTSKNTHGPWPMAHGPKPASYVRVRISRTQQVRVPLGTWYATHWLLGTHTLRTIEKVINNLALTWRVFAVYVAFMGESARVYEDVSAALRPA